MELTEAKIDKFKKAFGLMKLALVTADSVNVIFGGNKRSDNKLIDYSDAVLNELNRVPIDSDHLELLFNQLNDYCEEQIKQQKQ